MTLEKFRTIHSTLIEHYQFIEAHLEGIYAAASEKGLLKGLEDVEQDSINRIIYEIKNVEKEKSLPLFTNEEYSKIHRVSQRRNFWCHNCYFDLAFDSKTGGLKKAEDVKQMMNDLCEAEELREFLFFKKLDLLKKTK